MPSYPVYPVAAAMRLHGARGPSLLERSRGGSMLYASLKGGGNTSAPPLKGGGGRRGDSGLHGAPALAADVMHSPGVRFTRRVARRAGTGTGLRKPEKGARRRG